MARCDVPTDWQVALGRNPYVVTASEFFLCYGSSIPTPHAGNDPRCTTAKQTLSSNRSPPEHQAIIPDMIVNYIVSRPTPGRAERYRQNFHRRRLGTSFLWRRTTFRQIQLSSWSLCHANLICFSGNSEAFRRLQLLIPSTAASSERWFSNVATQWTEESSSMP